MSNNYEHLDGDMADSAPGPRAVEVTPQEMTQIQRQLCWQAVAVVVLVTLMMLHAASRGML